MRVVISGRGSVFLMCSARTRKYLPQPVLRCPVFELAHMVHIAAPAGTAHAVWLAEPPTEVTLVADGSGELHGPMPDGVVAATAGHGLVRTTDGLRLQAEPGRGLVLGYVVEGARHLRGLPAGSRVAITAE